MARALQTLLFVTGDRVVRADFAAGTKPVLQFRAHTAETPAAASIAAMLASGERPARHVWILLDELWTLTVTLPASAVAGLDPEQVRRALSYECEAFSGIESHAAELAYQSLPSSDAARRVFWATTADQAVRDELQAIVEKSGAALAGLLHPAGLARMVHDGPAGQAWSRLESWERTSVFVSGGPAGIEAIQFGGTAQDASRSQTSVLRAVRDVGDATFETLQAGGAELTRGGRVCKLNDEQSLAGYLSKWAEELRDKPRVPVIGSTVRPISASRRAMYAVALEVLVLGLCFWHYYAINAAVKAASARSQQNSGPVRELADLTKRNKVLKDDLDKLVASNQRTDSAMKAAQASLACQRERVMKLLQALAEQRPEDVVIERIESSGDGLKVSGLSLSAAQADALAIRLAIALKPAGWDVQPFDKKAQGLLDNGGPWSFTLKLERIAPQIPVSTGARAEAVDPDDGADKGALQ